MRKLLLALFAMALVVAFTAPSYAADFKMTGFYRIRGFSASLNQGDNDADDGSASGLDALIRPRFNTSVDGGKIKAIWEIDWWETDGSANANAVLGQNGGGRVGVGTNRWMVDFAVPGSALRARFGRTDYTSPDKEIFDSAGASRKPGIALYGKLSKNMSLSMFMFRAGASGDASKRAVGTEDENKDSYYAALGIKASPTVTLTPWVAVHRDGKGKSLTYVALHAKAKVGILSLSATGVSVGGEVSSEMDASGWAFLLRNSVSVGKLKLMANLTMLSGDDNDGDLEEGNFSKLFPNGGDIVSGVLISGRAAIFTVDANERIAGNQSTGKLGKTNGAVIGELGLTYQVSKTFNLGAGIYVYQSAEDDPEGDSDYGTELDVGMKWKIYPNLEMRAGFAILSAGDYGTNNDKEDSWLTAVSLRHIF